MELRWVGKKEAYHSGYSLTDKIIQPLKEQSKDFENTGNVLIKGDNLDALKLLQKNYFERIKMIYIDPPYNTLTDNFIYRDNFTKTQEEVLDELGYDKEQKEYIKNIAGAQTHSGWLSFIYPRLLLARELLRDDGVIFISIDDNEQANLKLLCDEVFGEMNFVANFSWVKTATPPSLSKTLRKKLEYVLCYKKNVLNVLYGGFVEGGDAPIVNKENTVSILTIPKEVCYFKTLSGIMKAGIFKGIELLDNIEIANGYSKNDFKIQGRLKWKQDFLDEEISEGTTLVVKSDDFSIRYIRKNKRILKPANLVNKQNGNVGTNEDAGKELKNLNLEGVFSNPKPTSLIKYLVNMNSKEDDIILDFFAGSGTTGDAVMRLNAEDGGRRKFVLVQLAEPIDKKKNKEAYDFVKTELKKEPTIFEIAAERLRRAGAKIEQTQQEKPQELAQEKSTLDTGFKIFALAKDKNNEIHRIKHSEQKQLSTELTNSTIQNETLLYNMLLGAGITFQEKIHCLIKNTCYQAKEHLFILQQFSLGKKNEASKENEAILEKASAEYAHIYNRNITDDEFILNLTKFIKKEKITLKEPL